MYILFAGDDFPHSDWYMYKDDRFIGVAKGGNDNIEAVIQNVGKNGTEYYRPNIHIESETLEDFKYRISMLRLEHNV